MMASGDVSGLEQEAGFQEPGMTVTLSGSL